MKLRHFFIPAYLTIAATGILTATGIIPLTFFELSSPFIAIIAAFIVYAFIIIITTNIKIRKQMKETSETELTFFCHGCAKPLPEPTRTRKGELVFHKSCIQ